MSVSVPAEAPQSPQDARNGDASTTTAHTHHNAREGGKEMTR